MLEKAKPHWFMVRTQWVHGKGLVVGVISLRPFPKLVSCICDYCGFSGHRNFIDDYRILQHVSIGY